MRSVTVGSRLASIQHSSGCRIFPNKLLFERTGLISAASLASATPPIKSLKPERYLVAEYSTMSAPSFKGCWNTGPSMVLSTRISGRFSPSADSRVGSPLHIRHHQRRIGRRFNQNHPDVWRLANRLIHRRRFCPREPEPW